MDPTLYLIQVNWYHYQCADGRLTPRWREATQFTREQADRVVAHERAAGAKAMLEVVSVADIAAANAGAELVERAVARAEWAHKGQFRRDGRTPYMTHVHAAMARGPKDPVSQCVLALHDTMESDAAHPLTHEEILAEFGEEVADGVDALTKRPGETYPVFIRRVVTHRRGKWRQCKLADCLANLSDAPSPRQCRKYGAALLTLVPARSSV